MKSCAVIIFLSAIVSANAATAGSISYTGNYPMVVTRSLYWNGTYCLTINDDGSFGWRHSGEASMEGNEVSLPDGTFQVINRTLMISIEAPYGTESLVFVAASHNAEPSEGEFEEVGGEATDTGKIHLGTKGGC